jgi:hypothetical protein
LSSTDLLLNNFEHNSSHLMKANFLESSSAIMASQKGIDITALFAALSSQMTSKNIRVKEHTMQNNSKILTDLQRAVQDNEDFKKDVHAELEDKLNKLK